MFDPQRLVEECREAVGGADARDAVRAILARAVADPGAVARAFGSADRWENQTLYRSPTLTVQKIWWAPGVMAPPHDHGMWAVIAVYAGQEDNTFFARAPGGGLAPARTVAHAAGEVLALDDDVIHAVANPRDGFAAALHVYGGDIVGAPRHLWMPPDLREVPFDGSLAEHVMAAFNARQAQEPRPWDRARALPLLMELAAARRPTA